MTTLMKTQHDGAWYRNDNGDWYFVKDEPGPADAKFEMLLLQSKMKELTDAKAAIEDQIRDVARKMESIRKD